MTKIRYLFETVLIAALALLCLTAPPPADAGPFPFTQNQFPVWYAVQATPVSITNAAETDLLILQVPPSIMGNAGYMRITLFADGDAGSTNHILTAYLGGPGHTNSISTALYTNTYKTSINTPITATIFPYVGGYSNLVYSTIYTNSSAGALKQNIAVGSQTNGLWLTITGTTGDTHGTYMTLGGAIIEALSQ